MPIALNNSPSATDLAQDPGGDARLEEGENAASPYEEHMLKKVMVLVYQSLADPQKLRMIESIMIKGSDLGITIGHMTVKLLMHIFLGAKKSGVQLPPSIFLGQGGAVMQVIELLMQVAEHARLKVDPDHVREEAFGIVLDAIRQNKGMLMSPDGSPQQQQPQQPPQMTPMAAGVKQGLLNGGGAPQ